MTTIEALNYQINSPTEDKSLRQFSATCARVICTITQETTRSFPVEVICTSISPRTSANVCPYQALFTICRVLNLFLLLRVRCVCCVMCVCGVCVHIVWVWYVLVCCWCVWCVVVCVLLGPPMSLLTLPFSSLLHHLTYVMCIHTDNFSCRCTVTCRRHYFC